MPCAATADDALLTDEEVSREFRIGLRFLQLARRRGGGPPVCSVGRLKRYRRGAVRDWIKAHEAPGASSPSRQSGGEA